MRKMIITKVTVNGKERLFRGLHDGDRFYEIGFEPPYENDTAKAVGQIDVCNKTESTDRVGTIYVARVRDVVRNINAAFLEYQKGKKGYFSLDENPSPLFLNRKNSDRVCEGDLIPVQLKKEAVKTKDPVLTSMFSLTGSYVVLNRGKSGIGFSGKITDNILREEYRKALIPVLHDLETQTGHSFGLIVRTNAKEVSIETVIKDLQKLYQKYCLILQKAVYSTPFTVLYREEKEYLKMIGGAYKGEIEEIVTDDPLVWDNLRSFILAERFEQFQDKLRFYEDPLQPLYKLYSIEKLCEQALGNRVWLKSGAYLVLEQTEAMYVIDVNTGKCIKGKALDQTILSVNLEAAKEIAFQLRLRNISGIIMIDFINMSSEEDKQKLISCIRQEIAKDRVRTDFVEITKLDLVALTRKKIRASINEQL